jgi:hypothetical protein
LVHFGFFGFFLFLFLKKERRKKGKIIDGFWRWVGVGSGWVKVEMLMGGERGRG